MCLCGGGARGFCLRVGFYVCVCGFLCLCVCVSVCLCMSVLHTDLFMNRRVVTKNTFVISLLSNHFVEDFPVERGSPRTHDTENTINLCLGGGVIS